MVIMITLWPSLQSACVAFWVWSKPRRHARTSQGGGVPSPTIFPRWQMAIILVSSSLVVGPSLKNGPASPPAHHIVIYMALGHHFPACWRYHLVGLAPFSLSPSLARSFAAGVVRRPLPDCTHSLHAHTLAQPCACSVCSPAAPRPEQFVMMCNGREILSLSLPSLILGHL